MHCILCASQDEQIARKKHSKSILLGRLVARLCISHGLHYSSGYCRIDRLSALCFTRPVLVEYHPKRHRRRIRRAHATFAIVHLELFDIWKSIHSWLFLLPNEPNPRIGKPVRPLVPQAEPIRSLSYNFRPSIWPILAITGSPALSDRFLYCAFLKNSHRVEVLLSLYAIVTILLLNAGIDVWWGGLAFGARYLIVTLPFFVIPLALLPNSLNWMIGSLGIVSAAQMLIPLMGQIQIAIDWKASQNSILAREQTFSRLFYFVGLWFTLDLEIVSQQQTLLDTWLCYSKPSPSSLPKSAYIDWSRGFFDPPFL